ncbi:MAG: hypothetical protein ACC661_06400, partial [Verrucomicrobiales bacterium]
KVEDEAHAASFRKHFNVADAGIPVLVVADAWGKPLASKPGPLEKEGYIAFVKSAAGEEALDIPAAGMFDLNASGPLVGTEDLTPVRTWTTVQGRKIVASLVEAAGPKGKFRTETGDFVELGFNTLSPADIAFLKTQKVLEMEESSFP